MAPDAGGGPPLGIAHVVRSGSYAGVERYICLVANELSRRGHRVTVIGGDPVRMRRELQAAVPFHPAASTLNAIRALIGFRIDVAHAHMTAAEVAALATRPINRARVVSTRHFPDPRLRRLPGAAGALIGSGIAAQVAVSTFVAESIGEHCVVIPNGVQARRAADLREPTVLMMHRLEREKAPEIGLRAWAASGLSNQGWRLSVAGSGALLAPLNQLSIDLGIRGSVRFLGNVTDTEDLLDSSSIFLAPAPAEPFGLAVLEAMAHGVPVVAAAAGGHLETLGSEALLFEPGDYSAAAEQLARLAADTNTRRDEGARLRARQQTLFSLARHVETLEALYRSLR